MPRARPQAKATTRPQQWLKASPRPQQWLLIGVQGCRLTGFKRLKCLAGRLPAYALCRSGVHASGTHAGKSHHKATAMAQGIPPAAAMASYRRSRLPFDRLQTLKMPRRPFACIALCRSGVHASGTPAGKSHHKATAMAQGIPPAAAMASYRRSRLPFDRLQTLKMPRRPFACIALCRSGVHASGTPAGKSHHKATAMAQGIPPAAAMASYRRSRLPFDRLQTLKMPRRPFACIALCR